MFNVRTCRNTYKQIIIYIVQIISYNIKCIAYKMLKLNYILSEISLSYSNYIFVYFDTGESMSMKQKSDHNCRISTFVSYIKLIIYHNLKIIWIIKHLKVHYLLLVASTATISPPLASILILSSTLVSPLVQDRFLSWR